MYKMTEYFFLGLFYYVLLFLLCAFIVIGIKTTVIYLTKKATPKPQPVRKRPTPKPIKSIEINPDEIERIYVKKSS